VVSARDLVDVLVGQISMDAVDERAKLAGVDEQRLTASVKDRASMVGRPNCGRFLESSN
jgi:hypothetical protein